MENKSKVIGKTVYSVNKKPHDTLEGFIYSGFVDGEYSGFASGIVRTKNTIELNLAEVEEGLKWSKRHTRAFREMIKFINEDFKYILLSMESTNNTLIMTALNEGFHINGAILVGTETIVHLIKIREES